MKEREVKLFIENVLKRVINTVNERTVLKLPDNNEPPADPLPPAGDEMPPAEPLPPEGDETPPAGGDPNIDKLVNLLNSNPKRAEDVLKYAKGIIDADGDEEQAPTDAPPAEPPADAASEPLPPDPNLPPPAMESIMKIVQRVIAEQTADESINIDEVADELIQITDKKRKVTADKADLFKPVTPKNIK